MLIIREDDVVISGTWCDATDASGVIQGTTFKP
jgi:hypothetical protein